MTHRLTLDYQLPKGRLAPYFDALQRGEAMAEVCGACGRIQFPPAGRCGSCGASAMAWQPLPGSARVIYRTDTIEAAFALVRFDGADNAALVRIKDRQADAPTGRLLPASGSAPGLVIALKDMMGT